MHMIVYLIFTLLQIFAKVQPDYMKEAQEYANDKMLTLTANYSGCDWASRCASLNSSFPVYHCLELKFIKNGGGDDATQGGGEDRGLGTEWGLGSQVQPNWEVPLIMPSSHQLWPAESWCPYIFHDYQRMQVRLLKSLNFHPSMRLSPTNLLPQGSDKRKAWLVSTLHQLFLDMKVGCHSRGGRPASPCTAGSSYLYLSLSASQSPVCRGMEYVKIRLWEDLPVIGSAFCLFCHICEYSFDF